MLKIHPEDIKETQILNTNLRREHVDDKQGILDVRLLMNDSAEIDIEIHLSQLKVWAERSLFYLSKMYTDKMEFHLIELPKLPKELKEDSSDVELWAKFINSERKEEFDMLAQKNQYIESAYERLQIISQDREKRLEYEAREKAILDHNQMILEAEERGEQRGEKRGAERVSKLYAYLIQEQRFEDLERSTRDMDFQQQLMKQYGI